MTVLMLGVLGGAAACALNPSSSGTAATAPRIHVSELTPTPGFSSSTVWVVTPVGLNVHSSPDPAATKLTTLAQDAKLSVTGKQSVGSDTWLQVRTESGQFQGWVLDRPDLVIHRAVSLHVESGSGYSILFPAEWSPNSGNPATFTGPSTGPSAGSMVIQTADDPTKLIATPTSAGHELRQESPVEVYGRTTFLTIYQLDAGGFEFDVKLQFPKSKVAYLFDFKQPQGSNPDTSLFKQLLASVIVPGEG